MKSFRATCEAFDCRFDGNQHDLDGFLSSSSSLSLLLLLHLNCICGASVDAVEQSVCVTNLMSELTIFGICKLVCHYFGLLQMTFI